MEGRGRDRREIGLEAREKIKGEEWGGWRRSRKEMRRKKGEREKRQRDSLPALFE